MRQDSDSGRDGHSADHAHGQHGGQSEVRGAPAAGTTGPRVRGADPHETGVAAAGSGPVPAPGGRAHPVVRTIRARRAERGQRGLLAGKSAAGRRGFRGQRLQRFREAFGLVAVRRVDSFQ